VNIGKYEDLPSDKIPGFPQRLAEAIPTLWEHRCSEGHAGGFFERLRMGTYMGHILEHVILELQSLAGMKTSFGRTRSAGARGEYNIIIHYRDAEAAKMCVELGLELVETLAEAQPLSFSLQERLAEIREVGEKNMLGPTTQSIVDAAHRRGIPRFRLNGNGLVQLGHGKYARRIQAAESSLTSNIAVEIASDKELTKELLDKVGVPVPKGETATDADDAWRVAQRIGKPVVVKPSDGNQGKAVSVNLTTEEQVRKAFALAREHSEIVIVEEYLQGNDFRMLVVDGKMVAAAQRRPAQVVGDGRHTISELVRMVNDDPRRSSGHGAALTRITLDAAAEITLSKQGYTPESVPPAGVPVLLRDNSNLSTGGTATDITDEVHPDNAAIAVLAAQTVGLDIAGIDVIAHSLRRPLAQQGGGIVEVNAAPGLRMHVSPSEGTPRPVGDAFVDMLFLGAAQTRVPLIAVTGTNGKTTVTRMIAHVYSTLHKFVGMTCTDGIYFNGVRHVKADASGPRSAEAVLQHPQVEVAVLETARGGILRSGLAWDRSTVSVVLNIAGDHMGLDGIDTLEQLARVKRVILESVSRDGYGVLNADDPLVAGMADYCSGQVLLFGTECSSAVMRPHLAAGGKAVYVIEGRIILAEGASETVLMNVADIPATYGGLIPFQVQNAMAAAAACWGAGVPIESIRLGLRTFQADDAGAPGRFNIFELGHAKVIVDYGHNPHALRAMQSALQQMDPRRAIGVIASPGDRRDADIRELAQVAAHTFDWLIVREDDDKRGREPGEVARMIASQVASACPSLPVCVIEDEIEAVEQALDMARDHDVVVVFADKVEEVIECVREASRAIRETEQSFSWSPSVDLTQAHGRDRIVAVSQLSAQGIYGPEAVDSAGYDGVGKGDGAGDGTAGGSQTGAKRRSGKRPASSRAKLNERVYTDPTGDGSFSSGQEAG